MEGVVYSIDDGKTKFYDLLQLVSIDYFDWLFDLLQLVSIDSQLFTLEDIVQIYWNHHTNPIGQTKDILGFHHNLTEPD